MGEIEKNRGADFLFLSSSTSLGGENGSPKANAKLVGRRRPFSVIFFRPGTDESPLATSLASVRSPNSHRGKRSAKRRKTTWTLRFHDSISIPEVYISDTRLLSLMCARSRRSIDFLIAICSSDSISFHVFFSICDLSIIKFIRFFVLLFINVRVCVNFQTAPEPGVPDPFASFAENNIKHRSCRDLIDFLNDVSVRRY